MNYHAIVAFCLLWLVAGSSAQDPCVCLEEFGTEPLTNPTFFKTAPGDDLRIFVAEQTGFLWIYDRDGNRNPTPFLNVSDRFELNAYDERGLLGMAFHPDFQTNRKFYVYFSVTLNDPDVTRVAEFLTDESNPNVADMSTEREILEIEQPASNHNGGEMFFGFFDGYLYIFTGDGGSGSISESAQDMAELRGKTLRIDVDTGDDAIPYTIPVDNPFVGMAGAQEEIYALGFRNPWRCTQDEGDRDTGANRGRMLCGDVGQDYCEEIDIIISGGNYGWNVKECIFCYPPTLPVPDECIDSPEVTPGEEVFPIYYYTEWDGQSVTGGHVYRGSAIPSYYGDYFWTDWRIRAHSGISRLREEVDGTWTNARIDLCDNATCGANLIAEHLPYAFAFGQDQDLEMYVLESMTGSTLEDGGAMFKIVNP